MRTINSKPVYKSTDLYLAWLNDFLTLDTFCECYGLKENEALAIINKGQKLNFLTG